MISINIDIHVYILYKPYLMCVCVWVLHDSLTRGMSPT